MTKPVLDWARTAKHGVFLLNKALRPIRLRLLEAVTGRVARVIPHRFRVERYLDPRGYFPFDFFLDRSPAAQDEGSKSAVPKVIYCFWTGRNPLTPNRILGLARLRAQNPDIEVVLVTPDNLEDFLIDGHPLHPAFDHLSLTHKSDYLRCYFMHFHGGGYSDIKPAHHQWGPAFEAFDDPVVWLVGYPETDCDICANLGGLLGRDVRASWSRLIGAGAYIIRPRTPFTAQWYAELLRRMDYYARDLAAHPATDALGNAPGYPVTWIGINSLIFHPLQLKYLDHVRQDSRLLPVFIDYR